MSKRRVEDLALFGGTPLFAEELHVGRPNIGSRERFLARMIDVFDNRWLTNDGPYLQELEGRLAERLGVKHCLAVCNATIGLEIAAQALGLTGEVIVPSFTFVATAHAMRWLGLAPVFCDIDPSTHNLDPAVVSQLITPRTSAILGVHVWGRACAVDRLRTIASDAGVRLLFDAAHAFGCSHNGRMIGGFGDLEVFSFHATKFFNSFEGGAISTNNDSLAERIRHMRNFGFAGLDRVVGIGTNGKMSEAAAVMALGSLESMEDFIEVNRRNHTCYAEGVEALAGVRLVKYPENESNNYQYVVVEIDEEAAGLDRDTLLQILNAEQVLARRYFYPGCHRMEPYRSERAASQPRLQETERLTSRVLQLPTGTAVDPAEISRVCELIRFALAHSSEIRGRRQSSAAGSGHESAGGDE